MDLEYILSKTDHTILKPDASEKEVLMIVGEAVEFGAASACIPPCYIKRAREEYGEKVRLCAVAGFPNGYMQTAVKVFECGKAVEDGADEVDVVINVGKFKSGDYSFVKNELDEIRKITEGKILKIIVETALLTDEEILTSGKTVTDCGADFIKTSTGFASRGATLKDIELFKRSVGKEVKIKAAGGIRTFSSAEEFLSAGADRIGASALVRLYKEIGR